MSAQCRIVAAKRPGLDNFGHHPTLKIVEACYFHIGFKYTTKCNRLFRYSTITQQQSLQCLKIRMIPLRFRGLASALLPHVKVYCPLQNGCVGGYCIKPRNPPNCRICETLRPHGQLIFLPAPGFHLHVGLTLYRNHCPHPQSEDTVDRTSKGIMTLGSSSVEAWRPPSAWNHKIFSYLHPYVSSIRQHAKRKASGLKPVASTRHPGMGPPKNRSAPKTSGKPLTESYPQGLM